MYKTTIALLLTIFISFVILGCVSVIEKDEAAAVYFNLGNAYFDLEKYDEAIKAYARAIELDSRFERASYNLARLYLETSRIDESIVILKELDSEDGENSVILSTLAYAYTLNGEDEEALTIYRKVLTRSSYDKNALYNIGILLWNKGELSDALNSFHALFELDPADPVVLYNLGILEIEMKNNTAGIKYLELYLEKEPKDMEAVIALGNTYNDEQYYGDALEMYNMVIDAGVAKPDLYFEKAYILLTAIGDSEEGLAALEQAVAGGYSDEELYQQLADDPELVDKERVTKFLLEKGLVSETAEE